MLTGEARVQNEYVLLSKILFIGASDKVKENSRAECTTQQAIQIRKKEMKKISVLLATRQRLEMLDKSIDNITNISDTNNVEILLAVDNDDKETLDFVQLKFSKIKCRTITMLIYKQYCLTG